MTAPKPPTLDERVQVSSLRRREDSRATRRKAILDAAGELLLEEGFTGFSLRKVAERIGYSATTIYRYFQNKDDLIFAVTDEGFRLFGTTLRDAFDREDDPLRRITELGRAYIDFGLANPVYYRVMFMLRPTLLTDCWEGKKEARIATFGILRTAVERAVEAGRTESTDTDLLSDSLWAMVHGVVSLGITMPFYTPESVRAIAEATLEIGARGVRRS